jgi:hypothetical protein
MNIVSYFIASWQPTGPASSALRQLASRLASCAGASQKGDPVFAGSQILQYTHIQLAVRESGCISNLKLVHFDKDVSEN